MTDRDLLELAAKAAGLSLSDEHVWDDERAEYVRWNPLTNDGDAFRLAVKLGLCVQVLRQYGETQVFRQSGYEIEKHNDDPLAATRRAIVRAAAEIGRAMS